MCSGDKASVKATEKRIRTKKVKCRHGMGVKQDQEAQNEKVISFLIEYVTKLNSTIKHKTEKIILVLITVTTTIKRITMNVYKGVCVSVLMCLSIQNH